jgi:phytoene synthase
MQLTNIARDVGEDARNGRLYLPRAWLREAGVDPQAWLRNPAFDDRIGAVIERLLAVSDALYRRSEQGLAALPRDCRPAIHAARLVYAEIGRELERNGLDAVAGRAVVSRSRKLALIARATGAAVRVPAPDATAAPALPAVQFLVDAAAAPVATSAPPQRSFDERVGWVIELCERQALQQQAVR